MIKRIALAQNDNFMGCPDGNAKICLDLAHIGVEKKIDILIFPEMFLSGYPAKDLMLQTHFVATCDQAILKLAYDARDLDLALCVGAPHFVAGKVFNAFYVLDKGKIQHIFHKNHLPNYDVFEDPRTFDRGDLGAPVDIRGIRIGCLVCEDAWFENVAKNLAQKGAQILIAPSASPFDDSKIEKRHHQMQKRVKQTGLPLLYLNRIGLEDEIYFDGSSFILNEQGEKTHQAAFAEQELLISEWHKTDGLWQVKPDILHKIPSKQEQLYRVMVESVRGYVSKNGFKSVLLGLSGGIDSAFVAALAVDALGADHVQLFFMPSEFTSQKSLEDAQDLAKNLGLDLGHIPIDSAFKSVLSTLAPIFGDLPSGLAEENMQSRLRGLFLMALSNKFSSMLLTTGNKSEVAVGYCTLYGDMAGGYNPVKDLYKTKLYQLAHWRNDFHQNWMKGAKGCIFNASVLNKAPTAELRPDQKDEDSLPPYDILDGILEKMIDQGQSMSDIIAWGYDIDTVKAVEKLVYMAQYKRHQAAPGVKLSVRGFGQEWHYPLTHFWRDIT